MTDLSQFAEPTAWVVLSAALLQCGAHLMTNQIALRLALFTGTTLYLVYYFVAASEPLWPAIVGTAALGVANALGLLRVLVAKGVARCREPLVAEAAGMAAPVVAAPVVAAPVAGAPVVAATSRAAGEPRAFGAFVTGEHIA